MSSKLAMALLWAALVVGLVACADLFGAGARPSLRVSTVSGESDAAYASVSLLRVVVDPESGTEKVREIGVSSGEEAKVVFEDLPEGTATVEVVLEDQAGNALFEGTESVRLRKGERAQAVVALQGIPRCVIWPLTIDFGQLAVEETLEKSFQIRNVGAGKLSGNVGEACEEFAVTGGGGTYSLAANETHVVTVSFKPVSAGNKTCEVVTGQDCASSVTCIGATDALVCRVSPPDLEFGPVETGSHTDTTLTIENVGSGMLSGVASLSNQEDFSIPSGGEPYQLGSGQSHSIKMRFAPRSEGQKSCTVDVGDPACLSVQCMGEGVGAAPVCFVSEDTLRFGRIDIGDYLNRSFAIRNDGGGVLSGTVSASCPHYSIVSGDEEYDLGPGDSHTVTVQFRPPDAGVKTCTVETGIKCANVSCMGVGGGSPAYVLVPAGNYRMGDGIAYCGEDEREVTLTRDFWLGQYEVTNQEYLDVLSWAYDRRYVDATSSSVRDNFDGSTEELVDLDDVDCEIAFSGGVFSLRETEVGLEAYPAGYDPAYHPMKEVTWYGAVAYCDWLSLREGLDRAYDHSTWVCGGGDPYSAEGYRLPTDAEWEYAAQWDDERIYPWGEVGFGIPTCALANHAPSCVGWTSPVGSYPAGAQSNLSAPIYDLAGNVGEWASDWFECGLGTSPETDPPGAGSGYTRVARRGSWNLSQQQAARASYRYGLSPVISNDTIGFRPARSD